MSQVNTSVEVLLKIRQIGEELVAKTRKDLDALAATQQKVAGPAGVGAVETANKKASASFLALGKSALGLVGAYQALGFARRAIAASNEAERAELRTLGVLQAQFDEREKALAQLERYRALSKDVAGRLGIFDDDALLAGLGRISVVNPGLANARTLNAAADLAVVKFGGNIDAAVEALADSFSGIGRGLQDVLPELRALSGSEQQRLLRRGGAVDLIEERFGGAAGEFRASGLGQQLEASRLFDDALEQAGDNIKALFTPALVQAAGALALLAETSGNLRSLGRGGKGVLGAFLAGGGNLSDPRFIERSAKFLQTDSGGVGLGVLSGALEALGFRGAVATGASIRAQASLIAPPPGEPVRSGPADPNALLGQGRVNEILAATGVLSAFEEKIFALQQQFSALQDQRGDFPFEAPTGIGSPIANATRDVDLLFNIAQERERAAAISSDLERAKQTLNEAVQRAADLVQSGSISGAAGRVSVENAAERFREIVEAAKAARVESGSFVGEQIDRLQALTDIHLPQTPQFLGDLTESITEAERALDSLNRRAQGLSQELSKRLEQPFANLIVATAKGEASLADFAETFTSTLAQIAAEEASRGILNAIFGGIGGATGFGSIFDSLGAAFGFGGSFDHGGLVPGADRGRDTTYIGARGGEFMLVPGAARALGYNRLDSINSAFGGRRSRGPSYAGGGLVDVVAAMGAGSPGGGGASGGVTVLPVLVSDRDTVDRLMGGPNALAVAEAIANDPAARRALALAVRS